MGRRFVTTEITTENIILRKLTLDDAEAIYKIRSDKENTKYVDFNPYENIPQAERFINSLSKDVNAGKVAFWGIVLNNDEENVIGTICLMPYQDRREVVEVGYELNRDFTGNGIMREALKAIIELCFNQLAVKYIYADTNINNNKSLKLLKYFNFVMDVKETENDFKYFYLCKDTKGEL